MRLGSGGFLKLETPAPSSDRFVFLGRWMSSKTIIRWLGQNKLWTGLAAVLLVFGVACGAAATPSTQAPTATAPLEPVTDTPAARPPSPTGGVGDSANLQPTETEAGDLDLLAVPKLDTTVANVPLGDIVFDTFGRRFERFVPLDQASEEFILALRDAIVPIYRPVYGDADGLPWLSIDDLVIGYVAGDEAFAYPVKVLNLHELVNDDIGGIPVLISYCPLCASGVVYRRQLDGRVLRFGNTSALYQSDLVMYDHQTGSYWFQTGGEAVVGTLTGSRLDLLPSTTMFWWEWLELYPETRLLTGRASSPIQFASPRYGRSSFDGYQERVNQEKFVFPVDADRLDDRISAGDRVLTVEVGDAVTAYPLDRVGTTAINDLVGGKPIVVFSKENNRLVGAFSRDLAGQTLTFDYRDADGFFVDQETGSVWDGAGRVVEGPLAGAELEWVNTRRAFWFSIVVTFPDVALYLPG